MKAQALKAQRAQIWKQILAARNTKRTAKQPAAKAKAKVMLRQAVARLEQVRKALKKAA